jgi:hypothetical protein
MDKQQTVLEGIIDDVAKALFQNWANTLPESNRSEENLEILSKNATEHTRFVIKMFVDKFNEAAAELKAQPDEQ